MIINKDRFRHLMCDQSTYEQFKRRVERGPYNYCIDEKDDTNETRLSFLDYIINEKGYRIREFGE